MCKQDISRHNQVINLSKKEDILSKKDSLALHCCQQRPGNWRGQESSGLGNHL